MVVTYLRLVFIRDNRIFSVGVKSDDIKKNTKGEGIYLGKTDA